MQLTQPIGTPKEEKTTQHVDDFTTYGKEVGTDSEEYEKYARWVLMHFRLPAIMKWAFEEFMREHKLFCSYKGETFRVIGASRMGDIWLTSDFEAVTGYEHRVDVMHCTDWSPAPCQTDMNTGE